jgi:hypothetical protein
MTATYEKIATTTLGSAVASYEFTSITGSYTDLVLVINGSASVLDRSIRVQYNSDTGTNYSYTNLLGYSGGAISQRASNTNHTRLSAALPTTAPGTIIAYFQNYSNTTTYKTHISRGGGLGDQSMTDVFVGLWRSTSAITSILIFPNTGNFNSGMTLTLYGIKAE